jgi:TonB family protein
MIYIFRTLLFTLLLTTGAVAYADNISGTYVGLYSNASELLQIVERTDGTILGHYEEVMLSSNGTKTTTINAEVSGAVSGNTIVLTMKPSEFLGGTISLSGSFTGDTLRLSGGANGGSFSVVMQRSTEAAFDQQVQKLTDKMNYTRVILARQKMEKEKENEIVKKKNEIIHLTHWLQSYPRRAAVTMQKLSKAPMANVELTKKMRAALKRESQERLNYVEKSQIHASIIQLGAIFDSWRSNLQSAESSFGYSDGKINNPSLANDAFMAQTYCRNDIQKTKPICKNFKAAYASYQDTVTKLNKLFTKADYSWHTENAKQEVMENKPINYDWLLRSLAQKIWKQVYNAWNTNVATSSICTVELRLNPEGQITGQPQIVRSSGNPKFDKAVITAIEKAAPFTPPAGLPYYLYKEVNLMFNAKELNH